MGGDGVAVLVAASFDVVGESGDHRQTAAVGLMRVGVFDGRGGLRASGVGHRDGHQYLGHGQADVERSGRLVSGCVGVWIRSAESELATGRRAPGDTKSDAGRRFLALPEFMRKDLERHLSWYAEKKPNGLLFVGEKGAPFRRSTFGRKWRRARVKAGLPNDFRFYDLRHTGHTLSTRSGATLKDTMVRAGQSSERAALIYQHSDRERQKEVAAGIDARVRNERQRAAKKDAAG